VAFEVRIPHAPKLATVEATTAMYDELRDIVPIIPGTGPNPVELPGPHGAISFTPSASHTRMTDRARTMSVVFAPTALLVETTAYVQFEAFLEVIERVLVAANNVASPAGVQRVGLRYIDEIRVEGVENPVDWAGYIHPSLLCAAKLDHDLSPVRTEGLAEFDRGEGHRTVMRFGAMTGRVVDPGGPLRLARTGEGSFFLIDLDSFWAPADEGIPEFTVEAVMEICRQLRVPIRTLFEASISDRLRDDVFRKEVSNT